MRAGTELWRGPISSLKRFKEDVREVQKGIECGVVLQGFTDVQVGDTLEAFEINYLTQDL
jgi:translation initiation factor IF-2